MVNLNSFSQFFSTKQKGAIKGEILKCLDV